MKWSHFVKHGFLFAKRLFALRVTMSYLTAVLLTVSLFLANEAFSIHLPTLLKGLNSTKADSLQAALKTSNPDTNKVKVFIQLSSIYRKTDYDRCMAYTDSVIGLSKKLNFLEGEAYGYYYKGVCETMHQKFSEAIAAYDKARDLFQKGNFELNVAEVSLKIGSISLMTGDFPLAVSNLLEASRMFEKAKDSTKLQMCYNNVAIAYFNFGQIDLSEEYLNKSMAICLAQGNEAGAMACYMGLGNVAEHRKEFALAEEQYRASLALAEKLGDVEHLVRCNASLLLVYNSMGRYEEAIQAGRIALEIAYETGFPHDLSATYTNLSGAYQGLGQWKKSIVMLDSALSLVSEEGYWPEVVEIFESYSYAYEGMGDFKNALSFYKKYQEAKDTLYGIEKAQAIDELNIKYETEKKEHTLALNELEIENQTLQNEQKTKQIWAATSALAVLFVVLIFLVILFGKLRRQKNAIEKKNKENELLMAEIHHRVKNNLQMISSLLNLQQRGIEDQAAKTAISEGSGRVRSMALVHNMLYRDDKTTGIEMHEYINRLAEELIGNLEKVPGKTTVELDVPKLKLDVDSAVPLGLILNELITNSLKYANEVDHPSIRINMQGSDNGIQLYYSDNGMGTKEKISDTSNSFGSRMIRSLTEQMKGVCHITDSNGLHYHFEFNNLKTY